VRSPYDPNKQRGVALLTALMIVAVLLILVGALIEFITGEVHGVAYTGYDNRALYIADSGIEAAVVGIEETSPKWASTSDIPNYSYAPEPDGSQASYSVKINEGKYVSGLRTYWVSAKGVAPKGQDRNVDAVVQEVSFSYYDYLEKDATPGGWWVSGLTQLNGPVYLEGNAHPENFQWIDSKPSIALDTTIVSGNYDYYNNTPPSSTTDWTAMDVLGQPGVAFKPSNFLPFPPDVASALISQEALNGTGGSTIPSPSTKGVYIDQNEIQAGTSGNLTTGIFVQGDTNLALSSTATTQTFAFTPTGSGTSIPNPVTVTVNFSANTTTVTEKSTTLTFNGVPSGESTTGSGANGAVFVNGNVSGLNGTVHGQYTIAVPDTASLANDIHFSGSVLMQNDPQSCGCTSTDVLGIYGHNLYLDNGAPNNITIEAALFAGNSHDVTTQNTQGTFTANFNTGSHPIAGFLHVYGSTVQHIGGSFGTFSPGCGCMQSGYNDSYLYDNRFRITAPPYYPRTGQYKIIAWKDKGV